MTKGRISCIVLLLMVLAIFAMSGCGDGGSSSEPSSAVANVAGEIASADETGAGSNGDPADVAPESGEIISQGDEYTPEELATEADPAGETPVSMAALAVTKYPAPVLQSALLNGNSYVLSWTQSGVAPTGGYDIVIDNVDTNSQYRTTQLTRVISGLTVGAQHCFQIQGRFLQANPDQTPLSNKVCVAPAPPASAPVLDSVQVNGTSYILNWSQSGPTPTGGYDLWIDGADTSTTNRTTGLTSTISGLTAGVQHCFEVEARHLQTDPDQFLKSNQVCVSPAPIATAPVLDPVQVNGNSFILNWSQSGPTPTGGYDLWIDGTDTNTANRTTQLTSTISGLTAGVQHCFEVEARHLQTDPVQFLKSNRMCATSGVIAPAPEPTPEPAPAPIPTGPVRAFPGAEGFGANAKGGRGGQIIKVTNLNDTGTGSLRAAVAATGPRIIVFEVSGTIELNSALNISNPYITIAGQTAPSPGVTLKCNATVGVGITAHDVVIQHLRLRGHDSGAADVMRVTAGYNIVIDHVTATWGHGDEIFSISSATARDITVSNSIFGEGLTGFNVLIGYGADNVTFTKNLLTSTRNRNPRLATGVIVAAVNNLDYNSGSLASVGAAAQMAPDPVYLSWVGNKAIPGPSSPTYVQVESSNIDAGTKIFMTDNVNLQGALYSSGVGPYLVGTPPVPYSNVTVLSSGQVEGYILANAGARPADRDATDARLIKNVVNRTGSIISSISQVGGFPTLARNTRTFNAGTNPNGDDNGNGYTNIEEILYQMAATVEGR